MRNRSPFLVGFLIGLLLMFLVCMLAIGNAQPLNIDSLKRSAVNEFLADVNNKVLDARKAIPIGDGEQLLKSNNFIELVNSMKDYLKNFKFK